MVKGAKPFEGAACEKRLKEWIQFLELTDYKLVNSHDMYEFIKIIQYGLQGYNKIICLGKKAENRLKKAGIIPFPLPHPSGLNRQNNNKEFINQKLTECKAWLNEKPQK